MRVAFAHWVDRLGDGRRAALRGARAARRHATRALRLKAIWAVVGPFERLVGAEPLALAVRRAEGAT